MNILHPWSVSLPNCKNVSTVIGVNLKPLELSTC